jgi:HSP20 family molecular chaperone IbpA
MVHVMNRQMEMMQREMDLVAGSLDGRPGEADPTDDEDVPSPITDGISFHEERDHYVVELPIQDPGTGSYNVSVRDRVLTVAAEETSGDAKTGGFFSAGRFSHSIQLPGAVQVAKMKVERKEGRLVITLPKAEG